MTRTFLCALAVLLFTTCSHAAERWGKFEQMQFGEFSHQIKSRRDDVCAHTEVKRMLTCRVMYNDLITLLIVTLDARTKQIKFYAEGKYVKARALQADIEKGLDNINDQMGELPDMFSPAQ